MGPMAAPPAPRTSRASIAIDTLRSLALPRRAVPLALVAVALSSAEWLGTHSRRALAVDLGLFAVFCATAPALWRVLFAAPARSPSARAIGWSVYAGTIAVVPVSLALLVPPLLGVRWTYVSEPPSLGLLVVLFGVGGWGLGRDIELERGVDRERSRAERLALDAEDAQLRALRAQLDPHFLFNTLNAIAEWCREDPLVAERATLALAELLRSVFEALQAPRWSVGRELRLLEQLGALYATRDPQRYVFRFDVPASVEPFALPPLVLLPLFENAIKHGPSAGHAGPVELVARRDEAELVVEIRNPGAFAGRREGGHGLALVERRLALSFERRARVEIAPCGAGTAVAVRLPAVPEPLP